MVGLRHELWFKETLADKHKGKSVARAAREGRQTGRELEGRTKRGKGWASIAKDTDRQTGKVDCGKRRGREEKDEQ